MTAVQFNVPNSDYEYFKNHVGYGNVSRIIREFIQSYNPAGQEKDGEKKLIQREMALLQKYYDSYCELKARLEAIKEAERQEELREIEKEKAQKKLFIEAGEKGVKEILHRVLD